MENSYDSNPINKPLFEKSESSENSAPFPKFSSSFDSNPPSPRDKQNNEFTYENADLFIERLNIESNPISSESVPDFSLNLSEDVKIEPDKSKIKQKANRKNKTKIISEEEFDEKMQKRAENNRKSAKESRERKKQYIESLENEVKQLKIQIEHYKFRLSKYENIEKHRSLFGYEIYAACANTSKTIYEENKDITDRAVFVETLKKTFDGFIEERRKALEQCTRAIAELVTPLPWRFFLYATEHNIDVLDAKKLSLAFDNAVPIENLTQVTETLKTVFDDKKLINESKILISTCAIKVKTLVKQLVEIQKNLQIEMKKIGKFIYENILPKYNPMLMQLLTHFSAMLKTKLEINNFSLYNLTDEDFGVESHFYDQSPVIKVPKKNKKIKI